MPRRRSSSRRCIVHVGSPKTGSSSIQFALKTHRRQLLNHGILVPRAGQTNSGSHRYLAYSLAGVPVPEAEAACEEFAREILKSDFDTVVISSEFLWQILGVPARAEALLKRLASLDLDVTVEMYVRNQPQWMNSFYQHYANFRKDKEFNAFVDSTLATSKRYLYSPWVQFAHAHGVHLLVRPFSADVRRTGVVGDFLTTLGLASPGRFDTSAERNRSIGPFRVSVAQALMRGVIGERSLSEAQASACRRALRKEVERRNLDDHGYCGLTTAVAARIEERYRDDNDRFAMAVWGRSWQEVFAGDVGRSFEPNDYAMVGVPAGLRQLRGEVLDSLEPEIRAIAGAVAA